jgi:hypothetical protein
MKTNLIYLIKTGQKSIKFEPEKKLPKYVKTIRIKDILIKADCKHYLKKHQ